MLDRITLKRPISLILATYLTTSAAFASATNVSEQHDQSDMSRRPALHFTPPSHWMNDPNGMVYYQDKYHLFYQHFPEALVWGPMHWGHATSKDLVNWQHQPIALYPDEHGMIFSGSAVIDHENRSGLGSPDHPPMIALFTYHDEVSKRTGNENFQSQGLAYSLDHGTTWTKYAHNPVLTNPGLLDFRDPKLSWHAETQRWIMVTAQGDKIGFYSSSNLIDWRHESDFGASMGAHGGIWECPDLIKIGEHYALLVSLVPGGPNGGSATQYFIGNFDGSRFTVAPQHTSEPQTALWLDWGPDNYAGVTFADTETVSDNPLFIGWANNWSYATKIPATDWRGMMTIPRELFIYEATAPDSKTEQLRLGSRPAQQLAKALKPTELSFQRAKDPEKLSAELAQAAAHRLDFQLTTTNADSTVIRLENATQEGITITLDQANADISLDRRNAGSTSFSDDYPIVAHAEHRFRNKLDVTIIYDETIIEVFVDGGKTSMTSLVFPSSPYNRLNISGAIIEKIQYHATRD